MAPMHYVLYNSFISISWSQIFMVNKSFIELSKIEKVFKKRGYSFKALKKVDLTISSAGFVMLSGKSGSGKTTLLNILGGLDSPSAGTLLFSEEKITSKNIDNYRLNNVSFVFQNYNLIDDATVLENLKLSFELNGKPFDYDEVQNYLCLVNLPDEEDLDYFLCKRPKELSGGQKQRLAIARALIKNPTILLLDEPTGALDKENSKKLLEVIKNLSKDRLVIVSTHATEDVKPFADRIIEISKGIITSDITINENNAPEPFESQPHQRKKIVFRPLFRRSFLGLLKSKIKLILALLLTTIITTTLGSIVSFKTTDSEMAALRTQYERSEKKKIILEAHKGDKYVWEQTNFNEKHRGIIKEYCNKERPFYLIERPFHFHLPITNDTANDLCSMFVTSHEELGIVIENESDLEQAGMEPDPRLKTTTNCRLPTNKDEVAITDLMANELLVRGLYSEGLSYQQVHITFDELDSIIGTSFYCFSQETPIKIVGIYKTEDDINKWEGLRNTIIGSNADFITSELLTHTISPAQFTIHSSDYSTAYAHHVMLNISGNIKNEVTLRNKLSFEENGQKYYVKIYSEYSGVTDTLNIFDNHFAEFLVNIASAIFVSIDILLLFVLFYSNIKENEHELGILRTLGATKGNIRAIVYLQGLLFSIMSGLFSLVATGIICLIVNSGLTISALVVNVLVLATIFLPLLFVTAFVTLISSLKAVNSKPINVIDNK